MTVEERFWSKVEKCGSGDCWEWQGSRLPKGYGMFRFNGRTARAHRVAWILAIGELPSGLFVCHTCDNPSCCNPAHLFLGTNSDNIRDAVRKGRVIPPTGGFKGYIPTPPIPRKLTPEDVRAIRKMYVPWRFGYRKIAKLYGVADSTIERVLARRRYKDV